MHIHKLYQIYKNQREKIKWFCIITIAASITSIYYFFFNKNITVLKIILLNIFSILLLNIFFQTKIEKKILIFIKNIKLELSKIVWPNYHETLKITGIVLLLIILTSAFLWILDNLILSIISWVLSPRL
ncbi:preprotein translocase subunit SecE [Buchnera aphidicola]|uniref:Protein translocase subunit SecE n=1 Tax=Buchnera aphidicola (Cinara strobi) TaxID=1921549 RepID=A0A3B1DKI0_9GAMM|nr:preprotein translocase subunit SecE [Buchnera aphidicola]VAX76231.1 Protein translocase subunit SecE [Buchnera aphidicola (Cinara strobi)]